MKLPKVLKQIAVDAELLTEIDRLASESHRSRAGMANHLIAEALKHREIRKDTSVKEMQSQHLKNEMRQGI